MALTWTGLDPEVEALLREIANSESNLFRIPKNPQWRILFSNDWTASARSAGQSAAERHLIDVYRAEVATHLLSFTRARLINHDIGRMYFFHEVSRHEHYSREEGKRPRRSLTEPLLQSLDRRSDGHSIDVLKALASEGGARRVGVEQLAMAAHRLWPSNKSRMYVALGCICREQFATASKILRAVLETGCSTKREPYIVTNLALAETRQRHAVEAQLLYERAADLRPDWYTPAFSAFSCAFAMGNIDAALAHGQHVEALVGQDESQLREFVSAHEERAQTGRLKHCPEANAMHRRIGDRLGDASRRIADALRN